MATGSVDASIPMSGTIGASLQGTQSQSGVMSIRKLKYIVFPFLPFTAAYAYSVIFSMKSLASLPHWSSSMAWTGQTVRHSPQPMQLPSCMNAFSSFIFMAPSGHTLTQALQPMHLSSSTFGRVECWSLFPIAGAHPIAMFFMLPPNPAISWPLKWDTTTMASAFTMSEAILAMLKCFSPKSTVSKLPLLRPSAMMIGAPATCGVNPCSYAVFRWSTEFFRLPL